MRLPMNSPENPRNFMPFTSRLVSSHYRRPAIVTAKPIAQATRDRRDPTTERIMLLKLWVIVTPFRPYTTFVKILANIEINRPVCEEICSMKSEMFSI